MSGGEVTHGAERGGDGGPELAVRAGASRARWRRREGGPAWVVDREAKDAGTVSDPHVSRYPGGADSSTLPPETHVVEAES